MGFKISTAIAALAAMLAFAAAPARAEGVETVDVAKLMEAGPLPEQVMGDPKAPVTIVEYASMTCSHCAHFHKETFPAIKENYVDTGKVRALGASNFNADRLGKALDHADAAGKVPFSALQNEYNLVARDSYGPDLQAMCTSRGIAMLPFFGLAAGYLTGKYRKPEDFEANQRGYRTKDYAESGPPVLAVMDDISADTGASLPAIALAWLVRQPGIPAPIASARNVDQLETLLEFTKLALSDEQVSRLTNAL